MTTQTKEGKANLNKVERFANKAIESLNSYELEWLIDNLVEYKDGAVMIRTIEKIENAVMRATQ